MIALAIICFLVAAFLIGRYIYLRKKQKEQKGFVVLLGTILFVYFFPGLAFFVIGVLLLLFLFH